MAARSYRNELTPPNGAHGTKGKIRQATEQSPKTNDIRQWKPKAKRPKKGRVQIFGSQPNKAHYKAVKVQQKRDSKTKATHSDKKRIAKGFRLYITRQ